MKKNVIIWMFLILQSFAYLVAQEASKQRDSIIPAAAAYLGQTPPGNTPVIFAPGIVSLPDRKEPCVTISPDGKVIFFYIGFFPKPDAPYIMFTQYSKGKWTSPEIASFSSNRRTGEPFFALNGNRIYMFATNAANQVSYVDLAYVEKQQDASWSNPASLGNPPNQYTDQYHPCIVADGSIYFANNSGEICHSQFEHGVYQKCQVLPYPINHANTTPTWGDPFVSPAEDYMIFKSSRVGGYGQDDIYISYKKANGSWTNPKNLGNKINTTGNETSGDITPDGKYMTYGCNDDIYWVAAGFINDLKHTNFVPYLKSKISDQSYTAGQSFNYTIPEDTFIDDDGSNTLNYSAVLGNGDSMPSWISFNPVTRTFSGKTSEKGTINIKIIATDTARAVASTTFTIGVI